MGKLTSLTARLLDFFDARKLLIRHSDWPMTFARTASRLAAVTSVLALLAALACPSAHATISLLQRTQSDTCTSSSTSCTVTITSTTAGTALVAFANNLAGAQHLTSVTDGGDTFSTCTGFGGSSCNGNDTGGGLGVDAMGIASGAGGKTSLVCNLSAAPGNTWTCGVYEFSTTTTGFTFDASGNVDDSTASTTQSGVALTLSGSSDAIVQLDCNEHGTPSINLSYTINVDTHSNAEAYLLNTSTGTAPTWTSTVSGRIAGGAIAFKEASGGGGGACPRSLTLLGVGRCG